MEGLNKKGQAQLIFNVVLGLLFIVVVFLIFFFISERLKDLNEDQIRDSQGIEFADSYVMSFRLLNQNDFRELGEFISGLHNNGSYFGSRYDFEDYESFAGEEFETFEGDVTVKEIDGSKIEDKDVINDDLKYTSIIQDRELVKFYILPLFSPDKKIEVNDLDCPGIREKLSEKLIRTFSGAYCGLAEVYYG